MIKVLLVFEDFNELTLTESYLKRVGFDIVGISNEILLQDQLLTFNPDIVVAHGKNNRVSSFSVGQKMKDNHKFHGKVVIVVPKDVRPGPAEIIRMKMDAIIESPLAPEKLIHVLCRLTNQDPQGYLDKLNKSKINDPENKKGFMVSGKGDSSNTETVSGGATVTPIRESVTINDPARARKYETIVKGTQIDIERSTHNRNDIKAIQKDLKKDYDFSRLEDQDELKRQFAEALFKKK